MLLYDKVMLVVVEGQCMKKFNGAINTFVRHIKSVLHNEYILEIQKNLGICCRLWKLLSG